MSGWGGKGDGLLEESGQRRFMRYQSSEMKLYCRQETLYPNILMNTVWRPPSNVLFNRLKQSYDGMTPDVLQKIGESQSARSGRGKEEMKRERKQEETRWSVAGKADQKSLWEKIASDNRHYVFLVKVCWERTCSWIRLRILHFERVDSLKTKNVLYVVHKRISTLSP